MLQLFSACHNQSSNAGKKIFRYNESKQISSLDPAYCRTMANTWVCTMLFNGLVQMDDSLKVIPCLAKSWTPSEDGTSYRFLLRNDVYFHSDECFKGKSRKVKASDVVYSFQRLLHPGVASPGRWVFQSIDTSQKGGFWAENDSVFWMFLKKPQANLLSVLTMPYCSVVSPEAVAYYGSRFREHPVGTGPFKFFIWKESVKLVLHKNEHYFEKDSLGQSLPYLDAVSVSFISDAQSAWLSFLQGRTDFLNGLDDGTYKDAVLSPEGQLKAELSTRMYVLKSPFLNTEYLGFLLDTSGHALFRDVHFRKALNYAIDRKKMLRFIRNNIGMAGHAGIVPPAMWQGPKPDFGYSYQPDSAKHHLQKSSYAALGKPVVNLYITAQYSALCEFIQHEFKKIGVQCKLEVNPPATHSEIVAKMQAPFFRKSWIADYADAENFLSLFTSENCTPKGPNYTAFELPAFDALMQEANTQNKPELRLQTYRRADSLMMQQSPIIVLFYDESLRFLQKHVSGFGTNAMNLPDLRRVKVPAEGE